MKSVRFSFSSVLVTAVLASAVYLKYSELEVRRIMASMGGSFDRLTVEHQFALTRYALNAGIGRARQRDGSVVRHAELFARQPLVQVRR